jgi:predicted ATPase
LSRKSATSFVQKIYSKQEKLSITIFDGINSFDQFGNNLLQVQKQIIAIIGGPGTGKSTLLSGLIEKGFCCYPEISRQITLDAKKEGVDQLFLENPLLFSKLLLEGRINQFENALEEPTEIVFIDRGIPDVLAYMNYIGDSYPDHFDQACLVNKYDKIFVLPPWNEIYVTDNARYENFQQAETIHIHLVNTYKKYGYNLIEVPKDSIESRIEFILAQIY